MGGKNGPTRTGPAISFRVSIFFRCLYCDNVQPHVGFVVLLLDPTRRPRPQRVTIAIPTPTSTPVKARGYTVSIPPLEHRLALKGTTPTWTTCCLCYQQLCCSHTACLHSKPAVLDLAN